MSDTVEPVFHDDEIHQFARGNASAFPYVMTAYALECGRSADDAAAFAGRVFAPGWEEVRGQGALVAARYVGLNLASCGVEVVSLTGDEQRAEVRGTGFGGEEELAFYGLTREEADSFLGTFGPIVAHLGLRAEWRREGESIVVTVDQAGAGG